MFIKVYRQTTDKIWKIKMYITSGIIQLVGSLPNPISAWVASIDALRAVSIIRPTSGSLTVSLFRSGFLSHLYMSLINKNLDIQYEEKRHTHTLFCSNAVLMNYVQKLEPRAARNYMWSDHWPQLKRTFRFKTVHSLPYPPKYLEKLSNEYVTHERIYGCAKTQIDPVRFWNITRK